MTTHVFIVNEASFPVHLKYMFAGTGAADKDTHIGLLADINRVRNGDLAIFYLERVGFFGIFEISGKPFKDTRNPTYLESDLKKKLIYRVKFRPTTVYPMPVSEWEALDKLPIYAKDVIWSLIYRKLKGNRGCTPITLQESDKLLNFIRSTNSGETPIALSVGESLTYDPGSQRIGKIDKTYNYVGVVAPTANILRDMIMLDSRNAAYEIHLQAYFTENIGISRNLENITGSNNQIIWIANEVSCGVGMQKIDIFSITSDARNNKKYNLVELKCGPAYPEITYQLDRYVIWTESYIEGAINSNIQPIIVTRKIVNGYHKRTGAPLKKTIDRDRTKDALTEFNGKHISIEVKWFEFDFINNDIVFEEVRYKPG